MKILQVITLSELGGAQSVLVNLSNELCHNHNVFVAAGKNDGKMWDSLDSIIKRIEIRTLKRKLSVVNDFCTLIFLFKLRFQIKPDIVHLHSSKIGILGRLVFPKSKIIYTVHGFDSIRLAYRKFLPIEKFLQKECRSIVGVSQYDLRHMLQEGITNNVSYIYNGIVRPKSLNDNPFKPYANFDKKVLCVARFSPQKDCNLFLRIASLLPQYAFFWIGNQHDFFGNKPTNVFFLGNLPNAGAYNEFVDLFILTSNYEGLPIVILEAMSYGKPVVASNVGGISEVVVNDENGYIIDNNPELFAEKIKYIVENKDVYSSFSQNASAKFEGEFTVEKMVNKYLDLYNYENCSNQ